MGGATIDYFEQKIVKRRWIFPSKGKNRVWLEIWCKLTSEIFLPQDRQVGLSERFFAMQSSAENPSDTNSRHALRFATFAILV
jgi:hypothetical protein